MKMTVLDQVSAGSVKVVLASSSPRRRELLEHVVPDFEVCGVDCEEVYPKTLAGGDIAVYLSQLKSKAIEGQENAVLLITADTIVWTHWKPAWIHRAGRLGVALLHIFRLRLAQGGIFSTASDVKGSWFGEDRAQQRRGVFVPAPS